MFSRSIVAASVCLGLQLLAFAGSAATETQPQLAAKIEALLPDHVGAAVLVRDHGETLLKQAWGRRRIDCEEPCTPATNFRLASISKQFTATAILRLVDAGRLELDDTLDRLFVECPDYWQQITVHQLLSHTSGLPDYEGLIPEGTVLQVTDLQVLNLLRSTSEPLFEPGAKFAYSNSGYTLLGLIVERVTKQPFQNFLEAEVFAPAGMERTVMFVEGLNRVPERAFGHTLTDSGQWQVDDQSVTSAVRGDGGIYSSLDDMEQWIEQLEGDFLLSPETRRAMFTPQVKTDRGQDSYGYGWFLGEYRGQERHMHSGGTRGFRHMFVRFPQRRAAVLVLLNRASGDDTEAAFEQIIDAALFAGASDSPE